MTTIYLVRHAEAEGNLYRRIHGRYNALITENGFRQIEALQKRFESIHIDAVYSSDLYRTMTTAGAVYNPKNLSLHTDPRLQEIFMGDWEDHPWGEVRRFNPAELDRFNATDPTWRAPNGETLAEVGDRMEAAIRDIGAKHPGQTIAIFSHGTAIRQFTANVKKLSPEEWRSLGHSDNTAVTKLTFDGTDFSLELEGDASHLDESISTLARQTWWRKDGKQAPDVNLWYRPIDWAMEKDFYLEARRDAWTSTHKDKEFLPDGFLADAETHLAQSPWGVTVAMQIDQVAGLIQLDESRYREDNAGYIPFYYMAPGPRGTHVAVQMLGHAVSHFRAMGRAKLRLRCAPYNERAQHFYKKYGFSKIGEETGSRVPLDIMEKYIGYDR